MIGYLNYTVSLLIVTGILILFFDVKGYKLENMKKEAKVSKYLGWVNVVLGLAVLIGNWVYHKWGW